MNSDLKSLSDIDLTSEFRIDIGGCAEMIPVTSLARTVYVDIATHYGLGFYTIQGEAEDAGLWRVFIYDTEDRYCPPLLETAYHSAIAEAVAELKSMLIDEGKRRVAAFLKACETET